MLEAGKPSLKVDNVCKEGNGESRKMAKENIFDVFVFVPTSTPKYRLFVFFILFLKRKDNHTNQNIQMQTPQTVTGP